jgi:hypothetical protein
MIASIFFMHAPSRGIEAARLLTGLQDLCRFSEKNTAVIPMR